MFLLLLASEQASLVLDDQVIFCLTVSLDKLPANTLKAKVRNIYCHLNILAGMDKTCSISFPQNAQNYYYKVLKFVLLFCGQHLLHFSSCTHGLSPNPLASSPQSTDMQLSDKRIGDFTLTSCQCECEWLLALHWVDDAKAVEIGSGSIQIFGIFRAKKYEWRSIPQCICGCLSLVSFLFSSPYIHPVVFSSFFLVFCI